MMKRILSLLTALLLLMSMTALGEEQVYDLIENALYRIVLRTEAGDQTLGTGVLFSDKQLLLTSAACVQEGEIIAIGPEGECAVSAVQVLDQSGAAMMELSAPASGTPLHLAADNAAGMAALFGTAADGEFLVAPLNQVRATIFRGQSALLLNSSEGLLPGSFLTDEHGNLIGLCIAQQAEGQGSYIALDANGLYRAISRLQYADAFLPAQAAWQDGELTISWEDEPRGSGLYLITISADDNQYYTYFEASHDERSVSLTVPPQHRYDYQVQWAESADSALEPMWASMTEIFVPGAAFQQYGYDQVCDFVTRTDAHSSLTEVAKPDLEVITSRGLLRYLRVRSTYDVQEKTELPMTIELLCPDGQFYFESAVHVFSPSKAKDDAFLLPLDALLADCAEFSGGQLKHGEYLLRYAIAGGTAGEYAFTLSDKAKEENTEETGLDTFQPLGPSGFITELDAEYQSGAITLTWPVEAVPQGANVTAYYMIEGNNYYTYHQIGKGELGTEIFTIPGRATYIWVTWVMEGHAEPPMPQHESDFLIVPAVQEAPFTLNGFQNQRIGLVPSADPMAMENGKFLPQVELTKELLTDHALPLYFQTEDTYQVDKMSEDHPMMIVLCTPEGLCFFHPLYYIFDPALQTSDLWLTDVSSMCRDYENLICGAWPEGHYRLMYCIDGQIAGEFHFTLK